MKQVDNVKHFRRNQLPRLSARVRTGKTKLSSPKGREKHDAALDISKAVETVSRAYNVDAPVANAILQAGARLFWR